MWLAAQRSKRQNDAAPLCGAMRSTRRQQGEKQRSDGSNEGPSWALVGAATPPTAISKLPLAFVIEELCSSRLSARQVISTWRVLHLIVHGTCDPGRLDESCNELWMGLPPYMK